MILKTGLFRVGLLMFVAAGILIDSAFHLKWTDLPMLLLIALVTLVTCRLCRDKNVPDTAIHFTGAVMIPAILIYGPHVALAALAIGLVGHRLVNSQRRVDLLFLLPRDVIVGWFAFQVFRLLGGEWGPTFDQVGAAVGMAGAHLAADTLLVALGLHIRAGRRFQPTLRSFVEPQSLRARAIKNVVGILIAFCYWHGGGRWSTLIIAFAFLLTQTLSHYFEVLQSARQQAQQLSAVLNATHGALIHTDPTGLIRMANRQIHTLFAIDPTSLVGRYAITIPALAEIRRRAPLPSADLVCTTVELTTGPKRFVHWHRTTLRDEHGELQGHVELFTDVTPLKEAERSLLLLHRSTIKALTAAIDARDSYTHGHSERVAAYAVAIAKRMQMTAKEIERIEYAGLLHDIGKLGIDDRLLRKEGALTPEEFVVMRQHPVIGAEMLAKADVLTDLIPGVRWHHEWVNGHGYPDMLHGNEIPLDARIISVADALDAMTTDRSYRPALPMYEALRRLRASAGIQFDPQVVAALEMVMAENPVIIGETVIPYRNTDERIRLSHPENIGLS